MYHIWYNSRKAVKRVEWAVGEVDCIRSQSKNGVSIGVYAPPGRAEQGRFALDVAVRSLDFYDEFFGTIYFSY